MADVSIEALQTVKSALNNFRTDLSGMASRVGSIADEIGRECRVIITDAEKDVEESEYRIVQLSKEIEETEQRIAQLNMEINTIEKEMPAMAQRVQSLYNQIS